MLQSLDSIWWLSFYYLYNHWTLCLLCSTLYINIYIYIYIYIYYFVTLIFIFVLLVLFYPFPFFLLPLPLFYPLFSYFFCFPLPSFFLLSLSFFSLSISFFFLLNLIQNFSWCTNRIYNFYIIFSKNHRTIFSKQTQMYCLNRQLFLIYRFSSGFLYNFLTSIVDLTLLILFLPILMMVH